MKLNRGAFMFFKLLRSYFYFFVRLTTASSLLFQGYYFLTHLRELNKLTLDIVPFGDFVFSQYIIFAHLFGGLCLLLGLMSRVNALFNLPILFLAVFFKFLPNMELSGVDGFFALVTFTGLIAVSIFGAGRFSIEKKYLGSGGYTQGEDNRIPPLEKYINDKNNEGLKI